METVFDPFNVRNKTCDKYLLLFTTKKVNKFRISPKRWFQKHLQVHSKPGVIINTKTREIILDPDAFNGPIGVIGYVDSEYDIVNNM